MENNMNIQWYPGHMTKTRRMIERQLGNVDAVCEILDARIPRSSRNPDILDLTAGKPRLVVLNRVDLADGEGTRRWGAWLRAQGFGVLEVNAKAGQGTNRFPAAVRELLSDKLAAYAAKGQTGRTIRVMVLGIPNVGKSTFINRVCGRKTAKAEDRPGVTRAGQWIVVDRTLELMDTPGMLWPKLDGPEVGLHLACTGAVRDEILDQEELACRLLTILAGRYPQALLERYGIECTLEDTGYTLLEAAGRRRGFLVRGGEVDTGRMARILLDEFRSGRLGRFTLELPEDGENG